MTLPGFTAEAAVYTSRRIYATASTAYGAQSEQVLLSRINDRRDSTAGYDPDKPRRADPFAAYREPPSSNEDLIWRILGSVALVILAASSGAGYMDCKDRGGSMEQDPDGSFRCVYPPG